MREERDAARHNGRHQPEPEPPPPEPEPPLPPDATAADLIKANAAIRWAWPGWLQMGVLNCLASFEGVGKTRLCADLARRIYHAKPWPDGRPPTFPVSSKVLWVAADNQHAELASLPGAFGFPPEALVLNTTTTDIYGGTEL